MDILRTRRVSIAVSLGVGLALGLIGPLASQWDNPACVVLSLVFSGGWSWVCYAFLVGYFCQSRIQSAVLPSLGLIVAVVAYYLKKDFSPTLPAGMEAEVISSSNSSGIIAWGVVAIIIGGPLGLCGNVARTPRFHGLPFRLIVPFVTFVETSMRLIKEADGQRPVILATWTTVRLISVAVALALMGNSIWGWWLARHNRSSRMEDPADEGVTPT